MHYAVHGHTAAELIYERADADKPHMGLTTWAAAPEGKIVKSDVSVARIIFRRMKFVHLNVSYLLIWIWQKTVQNVTFR